MHMDKQATFIAKAVEKHGETYNYSQVNYTTTTKKVEIVCRKHGAFSQAPYAHLRGQGCAKCKFESRKETTASFIKKAKKVHGDKYDYSKTKYGKNQKEIITITCPNHGDFQQTPTDHLAGKGCRDCGYNTCSRKQKFSPEKYMEKIRETHGDKYTYVNFAASVCVKARPIIECVCPVHGNFTQDLHLHMSGYGCPLCGVERRAKAATLDYADVVAVANKTHNNKYSYPDLGKIKKCKSSQMLRVVCPTHGEFTQVAQNHKSGQGCPKCCCNQESAAEIELRDFVVSLGVHVQTRDRSVLKGKELDILIPEHNLAIEFNGAYWHSTTFKDKKYHQEKVLMCQAVGVSLMHVYAWEWEKNKELIKDVIRTKLGLSTVVGGRKTEVFTPTNEEARNFCNANHMQGSINFKIAVGIRDKITKAPLGIMTFGASRFDKDVYTWELLRLCFKRGTRVTGGAGKMLKAFKSRHAQPGDKLVSYSSLDFGAGSVYGALGFKNEGITEPSYVWVKHNEVLSRYQTQKHRLQLLLGDSFNPKLTEHENMRGANYQKVYNSGNVKYSLELR